MFDAQYIVVYRPGVDKLPGQLLGMSLQAPRGAGNEYYKAQVLEIGVKVPARPFQTPRFQEFTN